MSLISILSTLFNSFLITTVVLLGLLIFKLLTQGKCKITKDLTGQVVIVTGSNTGIGKETACTLAKMGATVILACRNPEKSRAAVQEIQKRTGSSKVEFIQLDLADLHSVKRFVEEFKKKYDKLHILINNAGALIRTRETTKDGYEAQFGTNHLGHFYLTTLLLDTIKKSGPSRIINVSSDGHYICTGIKREALLCETGYNDFFVYCRTKFANVVFTKDLQSRLEGENANVKVVSLHPGMVRTELTRMYHEKWYHKILMIILVPMMYTAGKSIEEGTQTSLYCALEDLDKLKGGAYYRECKPRYENPASHKKENWVKLWDLSEELIDKTMNK